MRVLVCGSRHFNDINLMSSVLTELNEEKDIKLIIHGAARGADTMGGAYAQRHGIDALAFPAAWDKHGRAAGPIRNRQMLKEGKPDLVVAFMAPDSRGTKDMVEAARAAGVETRVIDIGISPEPQVSGNVQTSVSGW